MKKPLLIGLSILLVMIGVSVYFVYKHVQEQQFLREQRNEAIQATIEEINYALIKCDTISAIGSFNELMKLTNLQADQKYKLEQCRLILETAKKALSDYESIDLQAKFSQKLEIPEIQINLEDNGDLMAALSKNMEFYRDLQRLDKYSVEFKAINVCSTVTDAWFKLINDLKLQSQKKIAENIEMLHIVGWNTKVTTVVKTISKVSSTVKDYISAKANFERNLLSGSLRVDDLINKYAGWSPWDIYAAESAGYHLEDYDIADLPVIIRAVRIDTNRELSDSIEDYLEAYVDGRNLLLGPVSTTWQDFSAKIFDASSILNNKLTRVRQSSKMIEYAGGEPESVRIFRKLIAATELSNNAK